MADITEILKTDKIKNSRAVINTNFENLDTDIENLNTDIENLDTDKVSKDADETITGAWTFSTQPTGVGGYVDRGDPSAVDFDLAYFTTDGAFHDMDLSAIVPTGVKAVHLLVRVDDDAAGSFVSFRKNGNTNVINIGIIFTQVANVTNRGDMIVACDSNRVIEYQTTNTTFTGIRVVVKGWFM